jgi:hypothetical protein
MEIEEHLLAFLAGKPTVVAAIPIDRFYPLALPQPVTLPAAAYQLIDRPTDYHGAGESNPKFSRLQIRFCADRPIQARAAAEAVRLVLSGFRGDLAGQEVQGIFCDNVTDQHESPAGADQLEIFSRVVDYIIAHNTPAP